MIDARPGIIDVQLLLVRSLVDRASLAITTGDDASLMTAMLLCDVAVETITKMAYREKRLSVSENGNLGDHLKPLLPLCSSLSAEAAAVERLRDARNKVQHSGLVPSAQNVTMFKRDAEAYCAAVAREVFGKDYEKISVLGLVLDEVIRSYLALAVEHRDAARPRSALIYACAAFELLLYMWSRAILDARGFYQTREGEMERFASGRILPVLSRALGSSISLQRLEDEGYQYMELARMTLGFSIDELVRIQRLSSVAYKLPWEAMPANLGPPAQPSAFGEPLAEDQAPQVAIGDIDFVVDTVARQAWRLASAHPGLFARPVDQPASEKKE